MRAIAARSINYPTTFNVYEDSLKGVQYFDKFDSKYILNESQLCSKIKPFVVVMVKTAPMHFSRRQAIRETWGNMSRWNKETNISGLLLFSLGISQIDSCNKLIIEEHCNYSDIVQENYIDSFYNLTRKVLGQIKWINQFCSSAKYFMTTDDDMYINMPNLFKYLKSKNKNTVYVGCVHFGSSPNHDLSSKYYVPRNIYPGLYYPDYCPGAGYVISTDVVQLLYKIIPSVPMLYIDDVYIGILMKKIGVVPEHNARFFCEGKVSTDTCICSYFITSHGYNEAEMHSFDRTLSNLNKVGLFCSLKLWFKEVLKF